MADDETIPVDIDFEVPALDDFISNGRYAADDETPGELKPKRKYRSRKKEKEAVETISQSLAMLNGMFAMIVPCSCAATLPEELRGVAHRDTCAKSMPLDEGEAEALSQAIAAEFNAHPEWVEKLENADTWMAHAMLISCVFGIVMSRRMRTGQILVPEGVDIPAAYIA